MIRLTAKVIQFDKSLGVVTLFAADPQAAEREHGWLEAVGKSCGTTCVVGGLGGGVEYFIADPVKWAAMGQPHADPGFVLGAKVEDDDLAKSLEDGTTTEFTLSIGPNGISAVPVGEAVAKNLKGNAYMETATAVCKCGADKSAQHSEIEGVIAKAAAGTMNREEVWQFAKELAAKAKQPGEKIEKALDRVMEQHGLDKAYDVAPKVSPVAKVSKLDIEIEKQATLHQHVRAHQKAVGGRLSYKDAYDAALKQHPELAPKPIGGEPDSDDSAAAA